ncbi:traf2 and NCK-interacting protein kinase-like [Xenopus laevis]|uniref:Traf2 and NCK-interacting protein kinase-like n=1 Tax=Xenopus laevis TaxID=8355 RepID=A0A8J1KGV3_XENLA|nr:traf2 and NCK-interacting protein kinase-like [Xenopus laevis]XP_041416618.1 traf2 and NCK-interacting protein kinase-like [Xenopus laevis]
MSSFCSFSDLLKTRQMLRRLFCACCKGRKRKTQLKEPRGTLELGNLIGNGSSGQVYKGHNLKTNKVVAIKMMNPSEDTQKEIKTEIEIHKEVSRHKNIASFYGAYQQRGSIMMPIMIEMEFCGGGTLFELINSPFCRGLPEHCIAYVCREVLKGLSRLQKKQIMHRDIKSHNIAITEDASIRLIDFGLARKVKRFWPCKELQGTPHYIAPEVWTCSSYDFKCDIWALGITAIEMAETSCPLLHLQGEAVGKEIVSGDPPTLSRPRRWSPAFNSFIDLCLTKDPKDRPMAKFLLQEHHFITELQDEMQVKAEMKDLIRRLNAAKHLASKTAEDIANAAVEEVPSDVVVSLDTKKEKTAENAEEAASEVHVDEPASEEVVEAISPQDVGSTDIMGKQDTICHIKIGEPEKDVEASTTPKEDPLQSSEKAPELSVSQDLSPQEEVGSTDTEEEQTTVCHIDMGDSEEAPHTSFQSSKEAPVLEENTGD